MKTPPAMIGSARIGGLNSGWPCARLIVTPERLTISALFIGTCHFTPEEVFAFEKVGRISPGLRIVHTRRDISERCIFSSFSGPEKLEQQIRAAGFIPSASAAPQVRGVPYRWTSLVVIIVLWNGLGLLTFTRQHSLEPEPFVLLPLGLMALLSLGLLGIPSLRPLVMRPGRDFGELRPLVRFIALIVSLMFATLALYFFARSFQTLTD